AVDRIQFAPLHNHGGAVPRGHQTRPWRFRLRHQHSDHVAGGLPWSVRSRRAGAGSALRVETVLFVSLLGVTIGSLVRSLGVVPLYLGTVILGACLCFLGVLSPAVVKRDFPHHIGLMMGFYTMLVCVGPALSAATAVPFQHALGGN